LRVAIRDSEQQCALAIVAVKQRENMLNKIVLAVASAVILASASELIKWLDKKLNGSTNKNG
jgi:hypothetical protein